VNALRDIEAGEEITVSYINLLTPRKIRFDILYNRHGFACGCAACDLSTEHGRQSNANRTRLADLLEQLEEFPEGGELGAEDLLNMVNIYHEVFQLTDAEGLRCDEVALM
jgi:hypothetical protein